MRDAAVNARVTLPDGTARNVTAALADAANGTYRVALPVGGSGMYRVEATATRGTQTLGTGETWWLAGGHDAELADPRRHDATLSRLAESTGGRVVSEGDRLRSRPRFRAAPVKRRRSCRTTCGIRRGAFSRSSRVLAPSGRCGVAGDCGDLRPPGRRSGARADARRSGGGRESFRPDRDRCARQRHPRSRRSSNGPTRSSPPSEARSQ